MGSPTSSDDQQKEADNKRQEVLSKEYGEVCSNFRTLTDIRFKLLAFLPITAAAAVAALTGNASFYRWSRGYPHRPLPPITGTYRS